MAGVRGLAFAIRPASQQPCCLSLLADTRPDCFPHNVMFYRWEDYSAVRYLLIVPYILREEVLCMNHDMSDAGHTGQVNSFNHLSHVFIGLECTVIFIHMSRPVPSAIPTRSPDVDDELNWASTMLAHLWIV